MQEDDFLNEYRQEWQQEGRAMEEALSSITLEQLHENIARHEATRHRHRWWWPTVSAAACLALVATVGLRLLSPTVTVGNHPTVAQNQKPAITSTAPTDKIVPWTEEQKRLPSTTREEIPAHAQHDMAMAMPLPTQPQEAMPKPQAIATEEPTPAPTLPTPSNMVETKRLVDFGGNIAKPQERKTELLVNIVPPPRNTFHEAVIEPLLALATQDLEDY